MKKIWVFLILLQGLTALCWVHHASYLRHDYAELRYEQGVKDGERKYYRKLLEAEVEIPKEVSPRMPDKGLVLGLGDDVHSLTVLPVLWVLQGSVFVIMGIATLRSKPSDGGEVEGDG